MSGALRPEVQAGIDGKLAELRALIVEAVRAEEMIDKLTELGSGNMLNSVIQTYIDDNTPFWAAFIEVDKFKSVNDEFGYDNADNLLRGVAQELKHASTQYFQAETIPCRAHGDEFYLVGRGVPGTADVASAWDVQSIGVNLDHLRAGVARIAIRVREKAMRCTVSIGWTTSDMGTSDPEGLQVRTVKAMLERAVGVAKRRGRDCVVEYSSEMSSQTTREGRADCARCAAKFSVTVDVSMVGEGGLHCPNCGQHVDRPFALTNPTA